MSTKPKFPPPRIKPVIKAIVPEVAGTENFSPETSTIPESKFELIDLREKYQKDQETSNKNSQITEYLTQVIEHIKAETTLTLDPKKKKNNPFRIRSLQKGIEILSNHSVAIKSGHEAKALPGIGDGIAKRIDEILTTGKLAELETIQDDYVRLIRELTKLSGIGLVKAKKLIEQYQITGVADLIAKFQNGQITLGKNQLTHHQVIGLKYAKEIEQKIPRAEVDQINAWLQQLIPSDLIFEICGSYRRGKAISAYIYLFFSRRTKSGSEESPLLAIVERLTTAGLIVDHLTEDGKTKYMGICRLNATSVARRIDIRFIPFESWGPARLYFTCSRVFNQLFRAVSLQRGYTVSEYAVCPLVDGLKGDPIQVSSEVDIFKIIGVKYLTPMERE